MDDIIKLKFGSLATSAERKQYASNAVLAKIFGVSATKIREVYTARFQSIADKQMSFLQQLHNQKKKHARQRWGLRFLK